MRRSRLRLPLRIVSLAASLRYDASSTRSIVTGQLNGTSGPVDQLADAHLGDEMAQPFV